MEILNDTPFPVQPIYFKVQPRQPTVTLLTKGLFVLQKDAPCWAAPAPLQLPPVDAVYHEDDIGNSLRVATELAPYKPRADCLLLGTAYTPNGSPAEALAVVFSVGEMSKTLWIYGDRYWVPKADGTVRVEGPEPFTSMPLRNEFACGGLNSAYNKHGVGLRDATRPAEAGKPLRLANIQELNVTHVDPNHDCQPAGFGPLDPDLRPRADHKGTYDEAWLYRRKPLPPLDFNFAFYNAARSDQQIAGYLRGDEPLYFENLHREHRAFRSQLPGIRLRYFLIKVDAEGKASLLEATNNLDTCMVDMEEESVTLLWRGRVPIDPTGREQYTHAYIGQETLGEPRDTAYYKQRIKALLFDNPAAPPPAESPAEPSADDIAAREAQRAEQDRKMLDEAVAMMEQAKAPPEMVDLVKTQSDPVKALDSLMKYAEGLIKNLPKPPG